MTQILSIKTYFVDLIFKFLKQKIRNVQKHAWNRDTLDIKGRSLDGRAVTSYDRGSRIGTLTSKMCT